MYVTQVMTNINHYYFNKSNIFLLQEDDLLNYFRNQLHINDNQLFVVVTGEHNNWIASEDASDDPHSINTPDRR